MYIAYRLNCLRILLALISGGLLFPIDVAWADTLPPAYELIVAASNQRIEAAQKNVDAWKAKRDELAKKKKAIEKQMVDLAEKLGADSDPLLQAAAERMTLAEQRVNWLDTKIREAKPESFTHVAQFAALDRLVDERASLAAWLAEPWRLPRRTEVAAASETERAFSELLREFLRRDPQGAKLADEFETLDVQYVAAHNEAAITQSRRDWIKRAEGNLQNSLKPRTAIGKAVGKVVSLEPNPPVDAETRLEQFNRRRSPEGWRELGERFFSQMTLTLPGLEEVRDLVENQQYEAAFDAYKAYYFRKLLAEDSAVEILPDGSDDEAPAGGPTPSSAVFPPPTPEQIHWALDGKLVETIHLHGQVTRVEVKLGRPGTIRWVFAEVESSDQATTGPTDLFNRKTSDDTAEEAILQACRQQGYPGLTGAALLHSYAIGGPVEHLERWSAILDDWAMNWQRDAEGSPLPIRDYNVLYVCRIEETRSRLKVLATMRPSFVDDLPSDTLARWLMAMNEEYLASAVRLGRSGLYNFRIMALNSWVPTSLRMQEFHAHQWALREGWRQIDNNFVYKIRQDGANHEFANDGHENTDQALLYPFQQVAAAVSNSSDLHFLNGQSGTAGPLTSLALEPFWQEEFLDNLSANTRYWVHNMKQDGYSYRLNARSQRDRYLGASPEYKVNLLAHEEEVRRRLWHVHHIGKPEPAPQVVSESMAHQGYYYLRSGWGHDDDFLYFQSIGQPIMSGREDNTGFSLYGRGGIHLLAPALAVDGKTQNIHHGLVQNPGGKTHFATYGLPNVVKAGRFHTDSQFDFAEGQFEGVYQYHRPSVFFDVFGSYGYEASMAKAEAQARREGRPFVDEPITDVRPQRQVLSVRGRDTYIVTDIVESDNSHEFSQHYTLYTPMRLDHLKQRLALWRNERIAPLIVVQESQTLSTHNIGLPNLQLRHIGTMPVKYKVIEDPRPERILGAETSTTPIGKMFAKRDAHHAEATHAAHFSQRVTVQWEGQGKQVLLTLVTPQERTYETHPPQPTLRNVAALPSARNDNGVAMVGFTAEFADGTPLSYAVATEPRELQLGGLTVKASALLLCGDDLASAHGIALGCSRITYGKDSIEPDHPDFTFRVQAGRVFVESPIFRPIQPVVIEPLHCNVFTDSMEVQLRCPTPGVELRYTLDGTRPTPKSTRYTRPFRIAETCRLKVRAFRIGVKEDVWQQDSTHASVVYSTVLRKEPLRMSRDGVAVDDDKTTVEAIPSDGQGLKYEYFEGVWTELMTRSLTMPARKTGTTSKLFDTSPRDTDGAFGIRYSGYLNVPADGVYTFHAPREFLFPDNDCGYDLRVYVNDQEWNPAVRWHAHGTWSIALEKGKHPFRVVFADLRPKTHKVELMWGFPHPDFTWKGTAPELQISGPSLPKQSIPRSLLSHQ